MIRSAKAFGSPTWTPRVIPLLGGGEGSEFYYDSNYIRDFWPDSSHAKEKECNHSVCTLISSLYG